MSASAAPQATPRAVLVHLTGDDGLGRDAVERTAAAAGVPVDAVAVATGLLRAVLDRGGAWAEPFRAPTLVIACARPRAVRLLLHHAGVDFAGRTVTWLELPGRGLAVDDGPWFPVIDADACRRCGLCHGFCLFGVYDRAADGTVTVARPLRCKTGCPACARICPEAAIVFPLCAESPINGDPLPAAGTGVRVDLAARLGPDPMAMLRARQERARRLVDPARLERALAIAAGQPRE